MLIQKGGGLRELRNERLFENLLVINIKRMMCALASFFNGFKCLCVLCSVSQCDSKGQDSNSLDPVLAMLVTTMFSTFNRLIYQNCVADPVDHQL